MKINRRVFLRNSAAQAAVASVRCSPVMSMLSTASVEPMIGIQIGATSFFDEGINKVLDSLQENGHVNTVYLVSFSYDTATGGRGGIYPGHGKQGGNADWIGGNFATPHPQYYTKTVLKNTKAPDFGNRDVLAEVIPEAKKRGMKVYAWDYNVFRKDIPHIQELEEVDIDGNKAASCCAYNPNYRNFINGLIEDQCKSYPIDGVMWGAEFQGPLDNAIDAAIQPMKVTCFCDFHRQAARERGIDVDRAIEGYRKLIQLVKQSKSDNRPTDGCFVSFWRLCVEYPELLSWEKLWNDGKYAVYADIFATAKKVRDDLQIGFHIWHTASFSPFFRAEQNFREFSKYADFLKPVLYNECAGARDSFYIKDIAGGIFGDIPQGELYRLHNQLLNYSEKSLEEVFSEGFSADYVYRETKRTLEDVSGYCKIYPGIGVDIPPNPGYKRSSPEGVYASTTAAFKAGAPGIIFSRQYSEMRIENLAAGGRAVNDFIHA